MSVDLFILRFFGLFRFRCSVQGVLVSLSIQSLKICWSVQGFVFCSGFVDYQFFTGLLVCWSVQGLLVSCSRKIET